MAGINITRLLINMFYISDPIFPDGGPVYKIFFAESNVFEEIYALAFRMLNFYWTDMKASYMDFGKVLETVRTRLVAVVQVRSLPSTTFSSVPSDSSADCLLTQGKLQ